MKIKCPYCKSNKTDYVDTVENDINDTDGFTLESYFCDKCEEYFYVEKTIGITKIDIRKEKW